MPSGTTTAKNNRAFFELDCLKLSVPSSVYFPREDSVLLSSSVQKFASGKVLDLGCGSGIQGITSAKRKEVSEVVFADVNEDALETAKENCKINAIKKPVSFLKSNLFSNLKKETFNTIIFNPPYLPTEKSEKIPGKINSALDGGTSGRKTTDAFLRSFEPHLNSNGILLLLQSSLSDYEKTISILEKKGFSVSIEGTSSFFFEKLVVLLVTKRK